MKKPEHSVLCVDDDKDTCLLVEYMFKQNNYKVVSCMTADEGLAEAEKGGYSAIILDNWFAESSGVEICRKIRVFDSLTPIIFFSGEARPKEKQKAIDAGANEYLVKPNDLEKLTQTVIDLIEKQ
jgi:DNA-binding response OmpR family regulator